MYHRPRMCRTCLQMSRGDFKFVSLDAGDPLWESNSPNLKEQLLTLVPEMKLDGSGTVMCTSCFIALRTGYEFKKMCQFTEQRFQNYNYKYRRPFGVGPGSAQFHVTLNETRKPVNNKNGYYGCQNINFLQADTSIDITEHHLYDASKPPPRKDFLKDPIIDQVIKTPIESLPPTKVEDKPAEVKPNDVKPIEFKPIIESKPIEIKPLILEKQVDIKPVIHIKLAEVIKEIKVPEIKRQQVARKKITASLHIRKKYKIGSEISILKSENRNVTKIEPVSESKTVNKLDMIIKRACDEIEYLKENYITPKSLSCYPKMTRLSKSHNLEQLNKEAHSYYFDALETEVSCQHCSKTFDTKYKLNIHDIETHPDKQIHKCTECDQEFVHEINLKQHMNDGHATKPLIPNIEEKKIPLEKIVEDSNENKTTDVKIKETEEILQDPLIEALSEVVEDLNDRSKKSKESNIELEKDALLIVSKVVEDKFKFDDKKCKPSYEDDDEDFILEDNAFNISDSEDESIDIEINESEINQLLQDDYEGKIIKNITSKSSELNNKKTKNESKSPFIMILPKKVESVTVDKSFSNFVLENQVDKLLSKKQIEEKVNKLAEIQFVEVKRILPNRQGNTSTNTIASSNSTRESKELFKTNLNLKTLEGKIEKEGVQKDSQKSQLDITLSSIDNIRKELPKITIISQVKLELSKTPKEKVEKESPKPTTSTITKVEKEVAKNQTTIEKFGKLSSKKLADSPIIITRSKESPKSKVNVQSEKSKSPKKQDKSILEKGNKLKESAEVQKILPKKQEKPNSEKAHKLKESTEVQKSSPKKQEKPISEKAHKLKESTEVQKSSPKKQDKPNLAKENNLQGLAEVKKELFKKQDKSSISKGSKLQESTEMKTEVQNKSSKSQDEVITEKIIKVKESAETKPAVQKESTSKQNEPTLEKEDKLKESAELETDVPKQSFKGKEELTLQEGDKLKESTDVKTGIQKEKSNKQDKPTPEKGNKEKESLEVKVVVSKEPLKSQDKAALEIENKPKQSAEVENELLKKSSKVHIKLTPPEKGNKLKSSPEVQKTSSKLQDKPTPEKGNKKALPEAQKVSSKIQDKLTPEKRNKLKISPEIQKKSPEKQFKATLEKEGNSKESAEDSIPEIQKDRLAEVDKPKEALVIKIDLKTDVQKESIPTHQKVNKEEKSSDMKIETRAKVLRVSPRKQNIVAAQKVNKRKELPETKINAQIEVEEKSKMQDVSAIEPKGTSVIETKSSQKSDMPSLEKEGVQKKSPQKPDMPSLEKEVVQKKSPQKPDIPSPEKEVVQRKSPQKPDLPSLEMKVVQKKSPQKPDLPSFEKEVVQNKSLQKPDMPSLEKEVVQKKSPQKPNMPSLEKEVVQKKSPQKSDMPSLEKENIVEDSLEIEPNAQTEVQSGSHNQDMPTLEKENKLKDSPEIETNTKTEIEKQNLPTLEKESELKKLSEIQTDVQSKVQLGSHNQKQDMPTLEEENKLKESPEIQANIQSEVQMGSQKQDMPTLENVNKDVSEVPKMHLDPPILQNETNIELLQEQLDSESKVEELKMDMDHPPLLEIENSIELFNLQSDTLENLSEINKEKKEIEAKYVKPYWYKYINYIKCFICQKLCRNKLQLFQHCKFVHIPSIDPPKVIQDEEVKISENTVPTEKEAIKLYNKDNTPYKCNICDKQVLAKEYLDIHMYIHIPYSFIYDNDRVDNFICYICNKNFPKDRFMKLHNLQVHQTRHTVCKTCKRLFKSEFWYNRHKCVLPPTPTAPVVEREELSVQDEAQNNPHICNVCDRRFGRLRFLKSHQHRMHPEAYKINYGDAANTSSTLSDSITEASPNVSSRDVSENVAVATEESTATAPAKSIFDAEVKFLKSSESNFKRKSTDRMPKLQCDFCGTMIRENLYDSHIYEHNKKRMLKARKPDEKLFDIPTITAETSTIGTPTVVSEAGSTTETTPNSIPTTEKPLLKCNFCFRVFQRQYHLSNHIRKHHADLSQSLEVQSGNEENEVAEQSEENEISRNDSMEISRNDSMEMWECCGRQFKLKAHYARHCSTKHPDVFYKSTPSRPASPIPSLDVPAAITTRRNTIKARENDNESGPSEEPVKEKRVIKRKTLDFIETTESSVKKPKVIGGESLTTPESVKRKKTSESDGEPIRKKKSSPVENEDQDTSLYKYECSTCSKKFKQYNQLRDHNNVHTGDRPYKCFFCEPVRGFTQTSSLYVHFRRVHASNVIHVEWEPYSKNGICLICSSAFDKHSDMFQHAKDFYVEGGFDCNVCKENFTMSCHHRVHSGKSSKVKNKGENSKTPNNTVSAPVVCDPCDKVFETRELFRFHKKSLAHVQQVQALKKQSNHRKTDGSTTIEGLANSVGDILKTLSGMKKHKHYKHKCYACGKMFNKRINLKIHRRQVHRKRSKDMIEEQEDEPMASSSTDVPILDENEILKSITAKRRPSVLSENSDDKIDNQTDFEECDDNIDQSSQSSSQDDESENIKVYDDTDFDTMKLVESLQLPDDVINEVIADETSSEILSSQMNSAVEEIAFNVGYPSSTDDFPQDIIESDGVTYTNMRGVPIDSLE